MIENWFILTLIAAAFLGFYDIAKKRSLNENAVPPVLLLNVTTAAIVWCVLLCVGYFGTNDSILKQIVDDVGDLTFVDHLLLISKSMMVGASWMFAFFSLKHLPISIAAPIRATSPFWTVLLAVGMMGERPSILQWFGIALILIAFLLFSRVGKKEGIEFRHNRWVWMMVIATLISAFCGIYDKFLLQKMKYTPSVVQAWFSIYLVPVMVPLSVYWFRFDRRSSPFQWRWSIPLIAIFLLVADFTYFTALTDEQALISVVSPLRRTSLLIAFLYGIWFLKEQNWKHKLVSILILLTGVFLIGCGK